MKRYLAILYMLTLVACSSKEQARYAIVYGVSDYPYAGMDLPYSAADARSIAKLLKTNEYNVTLRIDTEATMQRLSEDFATVARAMGKDDLFLFYFSGHGINSQTKREYGDPNVKSDYFSLLLYNSVTYSNLLEYIDSNGVTSSWISSHIATIPTGIKVSILDACYSGQILPIAIVVDHTPADYTGETLAQDDYYAIFWEAAHIYKENMIYGTDGLSEGIFITSAGPAEIAWDGFFGHSVFTYFLLKSAELGDINGDGLVSTLEAYAFARAAMVKYWNTNNQTADWNFLPHITGGAADIVLFEHTGTVGQSILAP